MHRGKQNAKQKAITDCRGGLVLLNINQLKPYENNPRINDKAVEAVAASIKEFGFKVPIVVDKNNVIIAGHTRLKAAQKLGLEEVPVIVADDLTEEQIKAFRLADNKVSELAEWDFNALGAELANITEIDMTQFKFELDKLDPDNFGEDFELADGDKSEFEQITFTLHNAQAEIIRGALVLITEVNQTYGNTNKNGNAIFEIVSQWLEGQNE